MPFVAVDTAIYAVDGQFIGNSRGELIEFIGRNSGNRMAGKSLRNNRSILHWNAVASILPSDDDALEIYCANDFADAVFFFSYSNSHTNISKIKLLRLSVLYPRMQKPCRQC